MTKVIVKIEEADTNAIEFSKPRTNKSNVGKSVYMTYNQKPVYLQTPKMSCPFGISKWDQTLPVKYNLEAFFPDNSDIIEKFYAIENKYIDHATSQSQEFFGKSKSKETIIDNYISSVKPSQFEEKEDKYGPRLKCKLEKSDFKFRTDLWDGDNKDGEKYQKLDFNEDNYAEVVPRGCKVQCILSVSGWIVNGRFGLIYRIEQMIVFKEGTNVKLTGFSFVENEASEETHSKARVVSSDSDEDSVENSPPPTKQPQKQVELSDDSDDEPVVLVKETKKKRGFSKN